MSVMKSAEKIVMEHGRDLFDSDDYIAEKDFIQHGSYSVYQHSYAVACLSVYIVMRLGLTVRMSELVRGALLHDYFMYDWHELGNGGLKHAFGHAGFALDNARRCFEVSEIEADIIGKHMFPLNITPPRYREAAIVCLADKICALLETVNIDLIRKDDNNAGLS